MAERDTRFQTPPSVRIDLSGFDLNLTDCTLRPSLCEAARSLCRQTPRVFTSTNALVKFTRPLTPRSDTLATNLYYKISTSAPPSLSSTPSHLAFTPRPNPLSSQPSQQLIKMTTNGFAAMIFLRYCIHAPRWESIATIKLSVRTFTPLLPKAMTT
jgi:hypothetical protein